MAPTLNVLVLFQIITPYLLIRCFQLEAIDGTKQLNFGCVKAGKTVKKQTTLINRSKVPLTFELSMAPTSPRGVTLAQSISLAPVGATLKPNESVAVTVALSSEERIPNFSEEVSHV